MTQYQYKNMKSGKQICKSFGPDLHLPSDFKKERLEEKGIVGDPKEVIFVNVCHLYIDEYYGDFENTMFPNLVDIIIDPAIKDIKAIGPMLIRWGKLRFVFSAGMKETCIIPAEIRDIGYQAFKDTRCTRIIFQNADVKYEPLAFEESAWIRQNVCMIGTKLYRIRDRDGVIVIPEETKSYDMDAFSEVQSNIVNMIVRCAIPVQLIEIALLKHKAKFLSAEKLTLNLNENQDLQMLRHFLNLSSIEVMCGSKCSYSANDGVLYGSHQKSLVCYPPAKRGAKFIIPEGVERIEKESLKNTFVKHLVIPQSVMTVAKGAFAGTKLKTLTMYEGCAKDVFMGFNNYYNMTCTLPEKIVIHLKNGNDYVINHDLKTSFRIKTDHNYGLEVNSTRSDYVLKISQTIEYVMSMSTVWNQENFDTEEADWIYFKEYLKKKEIKWAFAINKCRAAQPYDGYVTYLSKSGYSMAAKLITSNREEEFVILLRSISHFLSYRNLQSLMEQTVNQNMTTATAYLLSCMENCSPDTKRKGRSLKL